MTVVPKVPVRKILFVVTSHARKGEARGGFHLAEFTHPYKVLRDAGFLIDIASPRGGEAPVDPDSLDFDDNINARFWNGQSTRNAIQNTLRPSEVDADDYVAVFFPGGHAAMWDLPDNSEIIPLVASIYENGGIVGAICHGPAALLNVRLGDGSYLVQSKKVSCFTNDEERAAHMMDVIPFSLADELAARGADPVPAPNFQPQVVVAERLVTGQNPASATPAGEAMLKLLKEKGLMPAMPEATAASYPGAGQMAAGNR